MKPTKNVANKQEQELNASPALAWQNQFYKKISLKLKQLSEEFDEIQRIRLKAEGLRSLRNKILTEKYD